MIKCAFTGHRPENFSFKYNENSPICIKIKNKISYHIGELIKNNVNVFITGMALVVDMWAAEIVIKNKLINNNIKLICAIPCQNQTNKWNILDINRYNKTISFADDIVLISKKYSKNCMRLRNYWMVDNSDILLAVLKPNSIYSGTAMTVNYAYKQNKKVILINPDKL